MTDAELEELERMRCVCDEGESCGPCEKLWEDIPRLIEEVRRLRAGIKREADLADKANLYHVVSSLKSLL